EGDGSIEIERVAGIEHAGPGDLTFLANAKYHAELARTRASAVIVGASASVPTPRFSVLRSGNPYLSFAHALRLFVRPSTPLKGIDPLAAIASDASIGPDPSVGPFVAIGSAAAVGARAVIFPNVVI